MSAKKKSYYINKLDKLISLKVRSLGYCERCGNKKTLQPAHIVSRKNKTLRWDLNNILCLCSSCHFWSHSDPLGFSLFIETKFPTKYEYVMKNKNRLSHQTAKDYKELLETI
jgi:5-methylcytosine-specific restriction endonuclease McrA